MHEFDDDKEEAVAPINSHQRWLIGQVRCME